MTVDGGLEGLINAIFQAIFGGSGGNPAPNYQRFQNEMAFGKFNDTVGFHGTSTVLTQSGAPMSPTPKWFSYKNAGSPVNPDLEEMINCFGACTGKHLVITGGLEPSPPHKPGSAHNTGEAADLGRLSNPTLTREDFEGPCFEQCFNPNEEGVYAQEES